MNKGVIMHMIAVAEQGKAQMEKVVGREIDWTEDFDDILAEAAQKAGL